jgi:hypothetical protein
MTKVFLPLASLRRVEVKQTNERAQIQQTTQGER